MTHGKTNQFSVTPANRFVAASGFLGGIFSLIGASCCVLPILLVQMGLASGVVARLGWFARWQGVFFWAAAFLLAFSAYIAWRRHNRSRLFWGFWLAGAVFLGLSAILPLFEWRLQALLLDLTR